MVCATLTTFTFNCCRVTYNPIVCMFKTQVTIVASSYFINTPWECTFLFTVLPLKWSKSEFGGMLQYLLTFCKNVCPLSITFMSSCSCWFVHLACLDALGNLLVLVKLCIDVMGGWHCYYIGVKASCECWISCVAGVIGWKC